MSGLCSNETDCIITGFICGAVEFVLLMRVSYIMFPCNLSVVVAWVIDRCRSCMVYSAEKIPAEPSVRKPRHLTKLIIATWVLALLMSLQHVCILN